MPELPEVETTVKGLQILLDNQITKVNIYSTKLRYKIPKKISNIAKNNRILKIYRKGKYILIDLNNSNSIVIHLGMSGRLKLIKKKNFKKEQHDRFAIETNNFFLILNDIRKFGLVDILQNENIANSKFFCHLGIDALDDNLNEDYLYKKIHKSIVPIKQILLDQRIISGIGNIYASEILYDAKISPFAKANSLKIRELKKIIRSINKILTKAIYFGGSSLKDFKSIDGVLGNFQKNFKVYNREGKKIHGAQVIRVIQAGRSTFYCPKVQNIID